MSGEAKIGLAAVILIAVAVTVAFGRWELGAEANDPATKLVAEDEAEITALLAKLPDGSPDADRGISGAPGSGAAWGGAGGGSDGIAAANIDSRDVAPSRDGFLPPPDPPASANSGVFYSYILQDGDSFWTVSSKVYGSVKYCGQIADANPGLKSTSLRPGKTIKVPAIPGVKMLMDLPPADIFAGPIGAIATARAVGIEPKAGNHRSDATEIASGGKPSASRPIPAAFSSQTGAYSAEAMPAEALVRDVAVRGALRSAKSGSANADAASGIQAATKGQGVSEANPHAGISTSDAGKTHTVARGDTLAGISRKYYGDEKYWKRISEANPDTDPNRLKTGAVLKIPPAGR